MPWGAIAGALASVAGSLFTSRKSAENSSALQYQYQTALNKQNYQYNLKLINHQNAFNEKMMDKANNYNTRSWNDSVQLANTAHQREVSDLRNAGLNPILSANGGASVVNPVQSAQASSGNSQLSSQAGMPNVDYIGALNTAYQAYQQNRQVTNELNNSRTTRQFTRAQTANQYNQMEINKANSASQIAKQTAEIAEIKQNILNSRALTNAQVHKLNSDALLNSENSARSRQETKNLSYQSAELQRHNDFLKSQSKYGRNVYNWIKAVNGSFGVSASAKVR